MSTNSKSIFKLVLKLISELEFNESIGFLNFLDELLMDNCLKYYVILIKFLYYL